MFVLSLQLVPRLPAFLLCHCTLHMGSREQPDIPCIAAAMDPMCRWKVSSDSSLFSRLQLLSAMSPPSSSASSSGSSSSSESPRQEERSKKSAAEATTSSSKRRSFSPVASEPEEPVLSHAAARKSKRAKLAHDDGDGDGDGDAAPARPSSGAAAKQKSKKGQFGVWIGNLAFHTGEEKLRRFLEGAGEITRVNMPAGKKKGELNKGSVYYSLFPLHRTYV
jgi:hypothetical protein